MTIDDDNSIYVGGLPYDSTEDMVRRAFDLYGAVVAVKIVNDREVGGKCYGFVTFANPRSAVDAINDMDGRTIGGRTVRVNEVRSRGGRMHSNRDFERDMDWDKDRDRGRDRDHNRDRYRDRNSDKSRDRDREREREPEHGRDYERLRDRADRDRERDHDQDRNLSHDRGWDKGYDLNLDRDREISRTKDHDRIRGKDKEQRSKNQLSPHFTESHSRELSSNSSGDYRDQVKEQIEATLQRRDELEKEIAQIEEKVEEKQLLVSDLQKKSQKLEESLASAKAHSSQRQAQLTKLQRCYMQVKDYTEKLKTSEKELQSLVDMAMDENDEGENVGTWGATQYANGTL